MDGLGNRSGNACSASGTVADGDGLSEPTAGQRNTQEQDRGPRPAGTSPAGTQNAARSLRQKTKALAYDADPA